MSVLFRCSGGGGTIYRMVSIVGEIGIAWFRQIVKGGSVALRRRFGVRWFSCFCAVALK